jgi:uncharacterized protein (TIGR02145 family)
MKTLISLACAMLFSINSFAQSPEKISYQSIVRDTAGKVIVNQLVAMKISLLKKTINGTVVYSETHRPKANANGLVTLQIGDGDVVFGDFSNINWGDGPFYLKTQVDPSGDSTKTTYTISGTTQLLSVPYALYANSASLRVSEIGDTLFSGKNFVLIPGISAANKTIIDTCPTAQILNSQLVYGNVKDFEGNLYKTITIGNQTWMAENLRSSKYSNGDSIPNVIDTTEWISLRSGAQCSYFFDSSLICPYGNLYNWYAVNDTRNVCPTGWHVPSDSEWVALEIYLGGDTIAGSKLKSTGNIYWANPNTLADNSTGFSGLPGGGRLTDGHFSLINTIGQYWTSTSYETYMAWSRTLEYNSGIVFRSPNGKTVGFSVRCIKDSNQ